MDFTWITNWPKDVSFHTISYISSAIKNDPMLAALGGQFVNEIMQSHADNNLIWLILTELQIDPKMSAFIHLVSSAIPNDPKPAALAWQVANEIMIDRDKKRALGILEWQTN